MPRPIRVPVSIQERQTRNDRDIREGKITRKGGFFGNLYLKDAGASVLHTDKDARSEYSASAASAKCSSEASMPESVLSAAPAAILSAEPSNKAVSGGDPMFKSGDSAFTSGDSAFSVGANVGSVRSSAKVKLIPTRLIRPNPSQPRKSFDDGTISRLADSIRKYGLLQPISVRIPDVCDGVSSFSYEIIAGERRYRASILAGMTEIPCLIMNVDRKKSAELAMIENIQREDLNIFEQAGAIASLIDIYELTQEQIAEMLSVSQSYIANKLRILKLTEPERIISLKAELTARHARSLLRLSSPEKRLEALKVIIERKLNVSKTEEYIEQLIKKEIPAEKTEASKKEAEKGLGKRKFILKDIRIFYNTLDRAIDLMSRAGISITRKTRTLDDSSTEIILHIPSSFLSSSFLSEKRSKRT